jgi:hypothetical protein
MNGYGASIVNGAVRAGSAVGLIGTGILDHVRNAQKGDMESEKQKSDNVKAKL